MFCAFEGPPRIVRLFGAGEVLVHPATERFDELAGRVRRAARAAGR